MYLEGHLRRKDVLDPDRKREWENDYEETVEQTKKQH